MTSPLHLAKLLTAFGLITVVCPASGAEELGRLFFTPEKRQALDHQRQFNIQQKQEIPEDPLLTINGVVSSSSGKRTVWINGVTQNENESQSGVVVTSSRNEPGTIMVQANDASLGKAKVGDTANRYTGEATDLLGDGRITVKNKQ